MLSALYQYALAHELVSLPGFKEKSIKGHVSLSASGAFLGFEPAVGKAYCPDMGSTAQSPDKCNVLLEKVWILLNTGENSAKHEFFLNALDTGMAHVPAFGVCAAALRDEQTCEQIKTELETRKIKDGDIIGFKVDGTALERNIDQYAKWWEAFRAQYCGATGSTESRCLITGQLAFPARTVPKVSGLMSVGGHSSGDALICFDKPAFQSYGLAQGANAAVSEEAVTAVNAALSELIQKAPILAGAKWIHWYDTMIPKEADSFASVTNPLDRIQLDDEDENEDEAPDAQDAPDEADGSPSTESLEEQARIEQYIIKANKLIEIARSGERPEILRARYHILCLSGASGRIMVRHYIQGSYETLTQNIRMWQEDLRIVAPFGKGLSRTPKMLALNIRLLASQKCKDIRKILERINKELPPLEIAVLMAIINGNPLPDTVAARALQYIRSDMLAADQEGKTYNEVVAFQLLKAWLVRVQRKRGGEITMTEELNEKNTSNAMLAGRLMAVYAKIQEAALGDVNAGVVQRYYISASTSPGLVIGRLAGLANHHLSKIDPGLAIHYQKMLTGIYAQVNGIFPATMNLEQQTEFALGYYQQLAKIYGGNKKEDNTDGNSEPV